jgi:hypothetical protein
MVDLFTSDFNALGNDQRYSAIVEFAAAQPCESNRHDFKLTWTNETLKDVAAFANTFGGILVIGVKKNQSDTEAKVVGVASSSELTTGIASAIATNISPTPSYDIMECHKIGEPNTRFCVVRIRSDSTLYLVTKKDISPAWVRNADQTVRADAAQLRGMIDREKRSASEKPAAYLLGVHRLFEEMVIGHSYAGERWPAGSWLASETFFKVALVPRESKLMTLDALDERRFTKLIRDNYRRVQGTLGGASKDAQSRSADYYEYRWYHKNLDYEGRWRITSTLEVAHSTQIREDEKWSLVDVVPYTALLLTVGAKWWESLRYFGDGVLCADLSVPNLQLARGSAGQFLGQFSPVRGDFGIRAETLAMEMQQRPTARAYVAVNFSTMRDDLPRTVTSLMNTLLRSLGHAVLWAEFEDNMRVLLTPANGGDHRG